MKRILSCALTLAVLLGCGGPAGPLPSSTRSFPVSGSADPGSARLSVTLADFKITPATLTSSSSVSIDVMSQGPTPHNLTIRDSSGAVEAATKDMRTGDTEFD